MTGPLGAFAGPAFDANDIAGHLAAFKIGRRPSCAPGPTLAD
jgi:hypothetical protein